MHPRPISETSSVLSLRLFIAAPICRGYLQDRWCMAAADKTEPVELSVGGRTVRITSPNRVYFSARGETKLDLAHYYLSVGDGIVRALRERPCMLHRFPSGVDGNKVHQKRIPSGAPDGLKTVRVTFPRYGRHADELCVSELASVIWAV